MARSRATILNLNEILRMYMLGSEEKIRGPVISMTARPTRVQGASVLASTAEGWPRMASPSMRRSTKAMVPIERAKPAMWMHSKSGNDHSLLLGGLVAGSYANRIMEDSLFSMRAARDAEA